MFKAFSINIWLFISFTFMCIATFFCTRMLMNAIQMKQVSASLQPGTAMNVTLKGNYTKMEGPYKAKLKSYYADIDETKTRDIEAVVSINKFYEPNEETKK